MTEKQKAQKILEGLLASHNPSVVLDAFIEEVYNNEKYFYLDAMLVDQKQLMTSIHQDLINAKTSLAGIEFTKKDLQEKIENI